MDKIVGLFIGIIGFIIAIVFTLMVFGDILRINNTDVIQDMTAQGLNLIDSLIANGMITAIIILFVGVFIVIVIIQLLKDIGKNSGRAY